MIRWMFLAAFAAAPAFAQDAPKAAPAPADKAAVQKETAPTEPPRRVRNVLLYGNQPCPKTTSPDEVVVCAHAGDSPDRIPEKLREHKYNPANQSWTNRVQTLDDIAHQTLPNSCSPIGTNGQTGCTMQMLQQWQAARAAQKSENARVP